MRTFTFGKYKGSLVSDVIRKDPGYVKWCEANIYWFSLTEDEQQILLETTETRKLMRKHGMHASEAMNFLEYDYPEHF